ncbi:MAG: hypothetical protein ACT4NX_04355 [Deltaproteobacteria bacterium]
MIFIRSRSGRFLSLAHIAGFAIEEQTTELEGQRVKIFNVIAYLPDPLYPAILGVFYDEHTAERELQAFMDGLVGLDRGVIGLDSHI